MRREGGSGDERVVRCLFWCLVFISLIFSLFVCLFCFF